MVEVVPELDEYYLRRQPKGQSVRLTHSLNFCPVLLRFKRLSLQEAQVQAGG